MKQLIFLFALLAAISCKSSQTIAPTETSSPPQYSVIYVIHGDANYLYHNADGKALQADKQVLEEAKAVGKQAVNGEVFIFHQKPENKFLWLFPKKDRQMLHYRYGQLVEKTRYSPQSKTNAFSAEQQLYNKYSSPDTPEQQQKIFLYFGHEIPERSSISYHASRPDAQLNTANFSNGLASFLESGKFDLAVLSTCNNGSPSMIHALTPHVRHVLASPKNLHLSHIDTKKLPYLIEELNLGGSGIADSLAQKTYRRLASFLQTAITIGTYDTEITTQYLPTLAENYSEYLASLGDSVLRTENNDCASLPFMTKSGHTAGIKLWYRPPRFGQKIDEEGFKSGWGCKVTSK